MTTMYRVSGHCAHATVNSPSGRVRQLFFKNQLLPPDCPEAEVQHLLSVKLIEPIQVGAPAPAVPERSADGGSGTELDGPGEAEPDAADDSADGESGGPEPAQNPPAEDSDVEAARAEARAKLEAAGGKPTGRHGQPVWVEHLVAKGYDYASVSKTDKAELVELASSLDR